MNEAACLPRADTRSLARRMRVAAPSTLDGFGGALRRAYDVGDRAGSVEREFAALLARLG